MDKGSESLNVTKHAVCVLFPRDGSTVQGMVSFEQATFGAPTKVAAVIRGLKPNSLHGLHIHEYGDFQGLGNIVKCSFRLDLQPLESSTRWSYG